MSNNELKPCPFCGAAPWHENGFLPLESIYYVGCSNGECILYGHEMFTPEQWNIRAQDFDAVHQRDEPAAFILIDGIGDDKMDLKETDLLDWQRENGGRIEPLFKSPQPGAHGVWLAGLVDAWPQIEHLKMITLEFKTEDQAQAACRELWAMIEKVQP